MALVKVTAEAEKSPGFERNQPTLSAFDLVFFFYFKTRIRMDPLIMGFV